MRGRLIEGVLQRRRWLLLPIYAGLAALLAVLTIVFLI